MTSALAAGLRNQALRVMQNHFLNIRLIRFFMTDLESFESLRGLQQDLIALDEIRLRNVDKLWTELEARIEEFRKLLDKPEKNEKSRKELLSGKPSPDRDS